MNISVNSFNFGFNKLSAVNNAPSFVSFNGHHIKKDTFEKSSNIYSQKTFDEAVKLVSSTLNSDMPEQSFALLKDDKVDLFVIPGSNDNDFDNYFENVLNNAKDNSLALIYSRKPDTDDGKTSSFTMDIYNAFCHFPSLKTITIVDKNGKFATLEKREGQSPDFLDSISMDDKYYEELSMNLPEKLKARYEENACIPNASVRSYKMDKLFSNPIVKKYTCTSTHNFWLNNADRYKLNYRSNFSYDN